MKPGVDCSLDAAKMRSKRAAGARLRSGTGEVPQGRFNGIRHTEGLAFRGALGDVASQALIGLRRLPLDRRGSFAMTTLVPSNWVPP